MESCFLYKTVNNINGKCYIGITKRYGSISQAAEQTEFTKKMIYNRLKNNTPGFAWVTETKNKG